VSAADATHCLVQHFSTRLPFWKRAMDIAFSMGGLLVLSPLLLLVAVAIKLDSTGPVFFKQQRMGFGRSRFLMWKFRTMVQNAEGMRDALLDQNEQDGPAFKIRKDPRVTRVGALLRKTSIDELPQLINVLRGDMTLVGPRPLPVHEAAACESWQDCRHTVHPGLTCIWQVHGRSRVSFEEWARMDVSYVKRVSLWHDIKILAMTIPAVIKQDGAH
ncbi:MAG: sugar transferase, partial [Rhodospirillales bacterium]|nr:sugar transferase [Rhodospirillales bacterium]